MGEYGNNYLRGPHGFEISFGSTNFVDKNGVNYNSLKNLPTVNGVALKGDLTIEDLGEETLTNTELKDIVDSQFELIFGGNSNG